MHVKQLGIIKITFLLNKIILLISLIEYFHKWSTYTIFFSIGYIFERKSLPQDKNWESTTKDSDDCGAGKIQLKSLAFLPLHKTRVAFSRSKARNNCAPNRSRILFYFTKPITSRDKAREREQTEQNVLKIVFSSIFIIFCIESISQIWEKVGFMLRGKILIFFFCVPKALGMDHSKALFGRNVRGKSSEKLSVQEWQWNCSKVVQQKNTVECWCVNGIVHGKGRITFSLSRLITFFALVGDIVGSMSCRWGWGWKYGWLIHIKTGRESQVWKEKISLFGFGWVGTLQRKIAKTLIRA